MSLSKTRVIISGGGTGGHVFPAIAIADALKAIIPDIEILFVGAEGRMEMQKVPVAGYRIIGLWISGLHRSLTLKNLSFPIKLIHSSIKARRIVKSFNPHVVVGVGGYASGPTLRAAASLGIPTILQEQNSYPGITNKILAKKATYICVAYPGMEKHFPKEKLILTGNPIRNDITRLTDFKEEALEYFNFDSSKPVILCVGGSLGALTLNKSMHQGLTKLQEAGFQVIWQTGERYAETAQLEVSNSNYADCRAVSFITRMDLAYAAADVVISRAGAIAISELCMTGKPAILVPSPNVAEDHQTRNAMALVSSEAALMIPDSSAKELLVTTAIKLAGDAEMKEKLSNNILKLGYPNAAQNIARIIINCINTK